MKTPRPQKPPIAIEVLLDNISDRRGKGLRNKLAKEYPQGEVSVRHFYHFRAAAGGAIARDVHEILVFMAAHKDALISAWVLTRKKVLDTIGDIVKEWAKAKLKKDTYKIYLYGPDGEPLKGIEIENAKERRIKGTWKEHARERRKSLTKKH